MNLAGKFLTFLILFMSLVFLVMAVVTGASHRNWKKIAAENQTIAQTLQSSIEQIKQRTTIGEQQLEAEMVSRQQQLAHLNAELAKERTNRDAKEKELTAQLVISAGQLESLKNAEDRLAQQDQDIAELRANNKALIDEIATRRTEVTTLTNDLFSLRGTLDELKNRSDAQNEQLAKAMKVLNANGLRWDGLTDAIEPRLEAVVMKTAGDLAIVSAGTDDGLRVGHVIDIYRGDQFVSKAKVINAEYNMSSARILSEFRQASVQEGDIVTTKF
jgi:hypothetical protein